MSYAIKDTVSNKFLTVYKQLDSSVSNANLYSNIEDANNALARLTRVYDNFENNKTVAESRGYTFAYPEIIPAPIWSVVSV